MRNLKKGSLAPQWVIKHSSMGLAIASGFALAGGYIIEGWWPDKKWLWLCFYFFSYVAGGSEAAISSAKGLVRGKFDIDLLMIAAAAGAALLAKWAEGAFLLFLFSLGHAGEHYAMDRAKNALALLGKLMPRTAWVKQGEKLLEVAVDALEVGQQVVVRPGDRVPVDGLITAGESSLDQSAITGESVPVTRGKGQSVFAGTINIDNALDIQVSRLARDNTLSRIMNLVAEAQEQKSHSQLFAEKFARHFVPGVLVFTFLLILLPPLALKWSWSESFYRGMLVLVAASPCALAIGTPAAILAGIARAARSGVLIKGGMHLENLGKVKTIALDKTGTITTGEFKVTRVIAFKGVPEEEVLRVAASVEEQSNHLLALAIVNLARQRKIPFPSASRIENLAGKGIRALVEGREVLIGALRAFEGTADEEVTTTVKELEQNGQTAVLISRLGEIIGVIGLADEAREETAKVFETLRRLGIERLVMLTGDNRSVANRIANHVGITEVQAELMPDQKLTVIKDLERNHGAIAMVGDGVNDAPALAAATVGIAMGAGGTAVALETADVVLMGDDLAKLPLAVSLSRASAEIIRQNIIIALAVIVFLVIASLIGVIPLSAAVVMHEGSTVVVVLNALRLLSFRNFNAGT